MRCSRELGRGMHCALHPAGMKSIRQGCVGWQMCCCIIQCCGTKTKHQRRRNAHVVMHRSQPLPRKHWQGPLSSSSRTSNGVLIPAPLWWGVAPLQSCCTVAAGCVQAMAAAMLVVAAGLAQAAGRASGLWRSSLKRRRCCCPRSPGTSRSCPALHLASACPGTAVLLQAASAVRSGRLPCQWSAGCSQGAAQQQLGQDVLCGQ
jgi:hypothetical protein